MWKKFTIHENLHTIVFGFDCTSFFPHWLFVVNYRCATNDGAGRAPPVWWPGRGHDSGPRHKETLLQTIPVRTLPCGVQVSRSKHSQREVTHIANLSVWNSMRTTLSFLCSWQEFLKNLEKDIPLIVCSS